MTEEYLKAKADKLWIYYAENIFENNGIYSYTTNLVFSFADYVENLSDKDLSDYLECTDSNMITHFRDMLNNAIDAWINDFSKTMAIM